MANVKRVRFDISGMSCGHCVKAVREALEQLPGVQVQDVTIGSATVAYDPAALSPDRMTSAIEDAGYAAAAAGVTD